MSTEDSLPIPNRFEFKARNVFRSAGEYVLILKHADESEVHFKLNTQTNTWFISKNKGGLWSSAFKNAVIVREYDPQFTDKYQVNVIYDNDPYIIEFIAFCIKNQHREFLRDIYSKYVFYRELIHDHEKR